MQLAVHVATDEATWATALSSSTAAVIAYRAGDATQRQLVWLGRQGKQMGRVANSNAVSARNPDAFWYGDRYFARHPWIPTLHRWQGAGRRIAIGIVVHVLEWNVSQNLHAIYLTISNKGTVAIVDPEVVLATREIGEDINGGTESSFDLQNAVNSDLDEEFIYKDWTIERGEEQTLHASRRIAKAYPAVRYTARVRLGRE